MLNFVNLLQTGIIAMGVATATPIDDTAQTITNDYTLTLNKTNSITSTETGITVNNSNMLDSGRVKDDRISLNATSNFLNVIGSEYTTNIYYNQDYLFRNEQYKSTVNTYQSYSSTEKVIILKITPYNYNLDTEMSLVFQVNMEDFLFNINEEIEIQNVYFQRDIYTTIQENWDTYIDRQLVLDTSRYIIEDINNVNNNYYYVKTSTNVNIPNFNQSQAHTDTIELTITPKVDNYIIINYIPIVNAEMNGTTYPYVNVYTYNGYWQDGPFRITGTNIIPDADYEVIDLPGLMWEILTMPFSFVSQAFNLTLFPGTPYQLNISNLFLSLFAIVLFIWLIKFILNR